MTTYIRNKKSDLSVLLNDTPEIYYWIGFLIADGHFSNRNAIKLCLSLQDKNHIEKFAKLVQYTGEPTTHKNSIGFSVQDKNIVQQIKDKFGISNIKTYKPIVNLPENDDLFLSFIIGLIDGDGNITKVGGNRPDSAIRIKCHNSWLDVLNKIHIRISIMSECINNHTPHLINNKYALLSWGHYKIVKYMKKNAIRLNLPILERKWSIIDTNYIGKTEKSYFYKKEIYSMLLRGFKNKHICAELNLSSSCVSQIVKRNKMLELIKQGIEIYE